MMFCYLFVSYPVCEVVVYDGRLCCRWLHNTTVAQNARECRVLNQIRQSFLFPLFLQLLRIMKNLSAGVLLQGSQTNKSSIHSSTSRWSDSLAMMSRLQRALSSNSAHDDASVIALRRTNQSAEEKAPR
ncbi:hypothetical protein HDV64DRAFT_3510 [Trichoderma sp. TUCIM 5745]